MAKYRVYDFAMGNPAVYVRCYGADVLPEGMTKRGKAAGTPVWATHIKDGQWSKAVLSTSLVDFGTGVLSAGPAPEPTPPAPEPDADRVVEPTGADEPSSGGSSTDGR